MKINELIDYYKEIENDFLTTWMRVDNEKGEFTDHGKRMNAIYKLEDLGLFLNEINGLKEEKSEIYNCVTDTIILNTKDGEFYKWFMSRIYIKMYGSIETYNISDKV